MSLERSRHGPRRPWGALAALVIALCTLVAGAARAEAPIAVASVGSIGLTVADADRSAAFFTQVLGFERESESEVAGSGVEHLQGVFGARLRVVRLRLADARLELLEYATPRGRPQPPDTRANDRWFQHVAIVVRDMPRAYARLRAHGVEHASSGPQRLPDSNPDAGGIEAFYFRDPDGHFLELIHFPPGRGDPRWQQETERLFLGVDHTAIVVDDTERSLAFYRDLLGLRVVGHSDNHGPEQEHLNGVFGARLRITALRAPAGPGIELLEYRTPRDGRPRPGDARANDVLHWQTDLVLAGPTLASAEARLFAARAAFVSPGAVEFPDAVLGFRRAFLVGDPDGHVLRVVEPLPAVED